MGRWLRTVAVLAVAAQVGCLMTGQRRGRDGDGDGDGNGGGGAGQPTESSGGSTESSGSGGDPGATTGGGSCDTSSFTGVHWWTPNGVLIDGYSVYVDIELRADGTYQRQQIVQDGSATGTLLCEYGTWQSLDCSTLELAACSGGTYTQSWSSTPSGFVLQGIELVADAYGVFNCGPTEC